MTGLHAVSFEFRQCGQPACRFRFPVGATDERRTTCPLCGAPTTVVETQPLTPEAVGSEPTPSCANLSVLLDNIRSIHNVGSIFRTADGAGVAHLYLAGITPTPHNPKLAKTALGAQSTVAWSHHNNGVDLAARLRSRGAQLWALETTPTSESLLDLSQMPGSDVVLVVGNEVVGVDPGLLALCERAVHIPMQGKKRSLNVAVAAGIAAYLLRRVQEVQG